MPRGSSLVRCNCVVKSARFPVGHGPCHDKKMPEVMISDLVARLATIDDDACGNSGRYCQG